jgi:hypothetical protein
MLQNVEHQFQPVNYSDLIPGKTYIIKAINENPRSKNSGYITRFRGKFVRNEVGKEMTDPARIRGLYPGANVSVFDNVEINSKKKDIMPSFVWVFSINTTNGQINAKDFDGYRMGHLFDDFFDGRINTDIDLFMGRMLPIDERTARQQMLQDIENNSEVGFLVDKWIFYESSKDNELYNVLGHLANDGPDPNDTIEQQQRQIKKQKIFQEGGPGHDIAEFAGYTIKKRNTSGDDSKMDVEGGRKRSRKNRRGRTRKGKSRKGKTRRGRRYYKK